MKITDRVMSDFLAGRLDGETRALIQAQLNVPDSAASRWFAELRRWARNAYQVDWRQLLSDDAATDAPATEEVPVVGDKHAADTKTLSSTIIEATTRYCLFDYRELLAEFSPYAVGVRSGEDSLGPFRGQLRLIVCTEWNWPVKRSDSTWQNPTSLAVELARVLEQHITELPFPIEAVPIVAALLVHEGLDGLCRLEEQP